MNLREQFIKQGVSYPVTCLSEGQSNSARLTIDAIIDECAGARQCILRHPNGKKLAKALLDEESIRKAVSMITGWDSVELFDFGISVRLPYSKRHSIWHRDRAAVKFGGSLVCLIVSLATAPRDSGLFFLGEFSCLTDLKRLEMPYHTHHVIDEANQPRKIIRVPLTPGQGLLFDCNVPHGNLMNYSASSRVALVGFFAPGNS